MGSRHWLGEDWHHVDIDATPILDRAGGRHPVDTICDGAHIPLPSRSFEYVFSSECIEHFPWRQTEMVVAEWARLVAPGGTMRIETPDLCAAAQQLLAVETVGHHLAMQQIFFAEQTTQYDFHYAGLTHLTLPHFIANAGLEVTNVERGWECGWLRVDGKR